MVFFCRAFYFLKRRIDLICTVFELKKNWHHLEEDTFFKGNVKYYWINYDQSRPLQFYTITLEGNYTATIANTANTLRQQSRPLSLKRVGPCFPKGKQSKMGFQKSNQNGINIIRL